MPNVSLVFYLNAYEVELIFEAALIAKSDVMASLYI